MKVNPRQHHLIFLLKSIRSFSAGFASHYLTIAHKNKSTPPAGEGLMEFAKDFLRVR